MANSVLYELDMRVSDATWHLSETMTWLLLAFLLPLSPPLPSPPSCHQPTPPHSGVCEEDTSGKGCLCIQATMEVATCYNLTPPPVSHYCSCEANQQSLPTIAFWILKYGNVEWWKLSKLTSEFWLLVASLLCFFAIYNLASAKLFT